MQLASPDPIRSIDRTKVFGLRGYPELELSNHKHFKRRPQSNLLLGFRRKFRSRGTPSPAYAPIENPETKEQNSYLKHVSDEDKQLHRQPYVLRVPMEVDENF